MSYPASEGCDGDYTLQRARARVIQPDMRPAGGLVGGWSTRAVSLMCRHAACLPAHYPLQHLSLATVAHKSRHGADEIEIDGHGWPGHAASAV